jgi:hypothetical protein
VYGECRNSKDVERVIERMDVVRECETHWGSRSLFKPEELNTISTYLHRMEANIEDIQHYFQDLPFKEQDLLHPLILKTFNSSKDVGTVGKSWKPISLIITIDHNILLIEDPIIG